MNNQSIPSHLRIFLLSFCFLLLLFGVAEIFLRIYYASNPEIILYSKSYESGKGIAHIADYDFHLNSRGYKDTEFTEKKQDSYRILALGDSFTFGNVPYSKSYIRLLEKNLNTATPELEIVNLGLPGIGLHTHLAILAHEGLALHPDMLLLSVFIGDDILQSKARKYYSFSYLLSWFNTFMKEKRQYQGQQYHSEGDYCDTCQALTETELIKLETERLFLYQKGNNQLSRHLEYTKFYLRKIMEICERHNIYPVVVLLPTVLQSNPVLQNSVLSKSQKAITEETEWQWGQPNNLLKDFLQENKIQHIDLLPPFTKQTDNNLYRNGDIHWNIAGHALAAEVVANVLQTAKPGIVESIK